MSPQSVGSLFEPVLPGGHTRAIAPKDIAQAIEGDKHVNACPPFRKGQNHHPSILIVLHGPGGKKRCLWRLQGRAWEPGDKSEVPRPRPQRSILGRPQVTCSGQHLAVPHMSLCDEEVERSDDGKTLWLTCYHLPLRSPECHLWVTWSCHEHPIALDKSIGGPLVTGYAGPQGRALVPCGWVGTVKGQMS